MAVWKIKRSGCNGDVIAFPCFHSTQFDRNSMKAKFNEDTERFPPFFNRMRRFNISTFLLLLLAKNGRATALCRESSAPRPQ